MKPIHTEIPTGITTHWIHTPSHWLFSQRYQKSCRRHHWKERRKEGPQIIYLLYSRNNRTHW